MGPRGLGGGAEGAAARRGIARCEPLRVGVARCQESMRTWAPSGRDRVFLRTPYKRARPAPSRPRLPLKTVWPRGGEESVPWTPAPARPGECRRCAESRRPWDCGENRRFSGGVRSRGQRAVTRRGRGCGERPLRGELGGSQQSQGRPAVGGAGGFGWTPAGSGGSDSDFRPPTSDLRPPPSDLPSRGDGLWGRDAHTFRHSAHGATAPGELFWHDGAGDAAPA
jgi:hypothetical protein